MKKAKPRLPVKLIVIVILIFLGLVIIVSLTVRFLKTADCFNVREIVFNEKKELVDISYLGGENIFSINLNKEAGRISEYYPQYRRVRIFRIIPDRLVVDFVRRRPIALVKLYRYFYVDDEGVLFNLHSSEIDSGLAVITGLETKIFGPRPSKKYSAPELKLAIQIIREAKIDPILRNYKIKKIDVTRLSDAVLLFDGGLEIKLDAGGLESKIKILTGLLKQLKNALAEIKYIDLRFKEPVIRYKETKGAQ